MTQPQVAVFYASGFVRLKPNADPTPFGTSVILGPRTMQQFQDNITALDVEITDEDEAFIDSLVPPGEHSGKGFQDTAYPITGRSI